MQGFFTLYRNLFARLAFEEAEWSNHSVSDYPSFGLATWTWSGPGKGQPNSAEGARFFYNYWLSFATEKDFSWIEAWSTNEAPDRQIRRLMEKDNKKARDNARKEYNDTVRVRSTSPFITILIFSKLMRSNLYDSHLLLSSANAIPDTSRISPARQD